MGANNRQANAVDAYIGERIRLARQQKNWTREDLADAVGVSAPQIERYEKGFNRVSASTLFNLSRLLGVDVQYFYAGLDTSFVAASFAAPPGSPRPFRKG